MSRLTVDPAGTPWEVHVEWVGRDLARSPGRLAERVRAISERRRRRRFRDSGILEFLDVPVFEGPSAVAVAIAVIIGVILLIWLGPFALAILLGAIELVLLALTTIAVVVFRVLFRRPWKVVAYSAAGEQHAWHVVGWSSSRRFVRAAARAIESGLSPSAIAPTSPWP